MTSWLTALMSLIIASPSLHHNEPCPAPHRALVFTQTQQMLDIVEKHAQAQV